MNDSMLAVFVPMTISFEKLNEAKILKTTNHAASISALFWYFAYTVPYYLGNNALTYSETRHLSSSFQLKKVSAFLIELFPYHVRTRGIGIEQVFENVGLLFSYNVNPIALDAIGWKFMAVYYGWIAFEWLLSFSCTQKLTEELWKS